MQAHANDLRSEVRRDWATLVDDQDAEGVSDQDCDAFVNGVVDDWRKCRLRKDLQHLLLFAERVTRTPNACTEADIASLRAAGWLDGAIHDAVQVIALFNYFNRVADALGVPPERDLPHWGIAE